MTLQKLKVNLLERFLHLLQRLVGRNKPRPLLCIVDLFIDSTFSSLRVSYIFISFLCLVQSHFVSVCLQRQADWCFQEERVEGFSYLVLSIFSLLLRFPRTLSFEIVGLDNFKHLRFIKAELISQLQGNELGFFDQKLANKFVLPHPISIIPVSTSWFLLMRCCSITVKAWRFES